jgi:hypothetical protein
LRDMRTIMRECDYATFQEMRQVILDDNPGALINDIYDKKNGKAYFSFRHDRYIPKEWIEYII